MAPRNKDLGEPIDSNLYKKAPIRNESNGCFETRWSSVDFSEGSPRPGSNIYLASMERRVKTKKCPRH